MLDSEFVLRLRNLINSHCIENMSDTPDFILANYLKNCLENFAEAVNARETWYGREPEIIEQVPEQPE